MVFRTRDSKLLSAFRCPIARAYLKHSKCSPSKHPNILPVSVGERLEGYQVKTPSSGVTNEKGEICTCKPNKDAVEGEKIPSYKVEYLSRWNDALTMVILSITAISGSEIFSRAFQSVEDKSIDVVVVMLEMAALISTLGFISYIHTDLNQKRGEHAGNSIQAKSMCPRLLVPTVFYLLAVVFFLVPLAIAVYSTVGRTAGFISICLFSFFLVAFFAGEVYIWKGRPTHYIGA